MIHQLALAARCRVSGCGLELSEKTVQPAEGQSAQVLQSKARNEPIVVEVRVSSELLRVNNKTIASAARVLAASDERIALLVCISMHKTPHCTLAVPDRCIRVTMFGSFSAARLRPDMLEQIDPKGAGGDAFSSEEGLPGPGARPVLGCDR